MEEVHALALEDDWEVFFADVREANEHAVAAVQCLDHVMLTEHHIVKDCTIWSQVTRLDCISVDWLIGWAEVMSVDHCTLTKEQFTEVIVVIIELLNSER